MAAFEELQGILLDIALVITQPAQHCAVSIESQSGVKAELLLVHPIGNAVDDLIELSVLSDLTLAVVIEQLDQKDVVVSDKGHLLSVGRPHGALLRTAIRERLQLAALQRVDVEHRLVGTAVDRLTLRADEHTAAVGRHDIAVEGIYLRTLCVVDIEEHCRLFTGLERALHYLLAIGRDTRILVGTGDRVDARNCLSGKFSGSETLQINGGSSKDT